METLVQENMTKLTMLNKKLSENDFDQVAEVALLARANLEAFREHLPMIKYIKSEAIMPEDWNLIRDSVGKPDLERDQIKVASFTEEKLSEHFAEIEDIVFRAEKKF